MSKQADIHVVTEDGQQCFLWRNNQLSYISQDRRELPLALATKFGPFATKLDLSYNTLVSLNNINLFTNLNELVLDNNLLEDNQLQLRQNLRLKTLSLNKNRLRNLFRLINNIKVSFPNLEYLSLLGNPLCPTPTLLDQQHWSPPTASPSELAHYRYRQFVIHHLPNLRFLDSSLVTAQERDTALASCLWTTEPHLASSDQNGHSAEKVVQYEIMSDCDTCSIATAQQTTLVQAINDHNNNNNQGQARAAFSRLSYRYSGKNSEGNRFICNHDL